VLLSNVHFNDNSPLQIPQHGIYIPKAASRKPSFGKHIEVPVLLAGPEIKVMYGVQIARLVGKVTGDDNTQNTSTHLFKSAVIIIIIIMHLAHNLLRNVI
jgi:hypothetical protein